MEDFTLGLALYDFLPGIISGVGLYFVARIVHRFDQKNASLAYAGVGLVVLAGLLKATWKLIATVSGVDILWMYNALFPLMAPGFFLIAVSFWSAVRRTRSKPTLANLWVLPALVISGLLAFVAVLTFGFGSERIWYTVSMMLASVANLGLTIMLVAAAVRQKQWVAAPLFTVNILLIFVLQQIAQIDPKPVGLHWLEQTLTVVGMAAFAVGGYMLMRAYQAEEPTLEAQPVPAAGR